MWSVLQFLRDGWACGGFFFTFLCDVADVNLQCNFGLNYHDKFFCDNIWHFSVSAFFGKWLSDLHLAVDKFHA